MILFEILSHFDYRILQLKSFQIIQSKWHSTKGIIKYDLQLTTFNKTSYGELLVNSTGLEYGNHDFNGNLLW